MSGCDVMREISAESVEMTPKASDSNKNVRMRLNASGQDKKFRGDA